MFDKEPTCSGRWLVQNQAWGLWLAESWVVGGTCCTSPPPPPVSAEERCIVGCGGQAKRWTSSVWRDDALNTAAHKHTITWNKLQYMLFYFIVYLTRKMHNIYCARYSLKLISMCSPWAEATSVAQAGEVKENNQLWWIKTLHCETSILKSR